MPATQSRSRSAHNTRRYESCPPALLLKSPLKSPPLSAHRPITRSFLPGAEVIFHPEIEAAWFTAPRSALSLLLDKPSRLPPVQAAPVAAQWPTRMLPVRGRIVRCPTPAPPSRRNAPP